MSESEFPPSDRTRFGFRMGDTPRDRRIAAWIDWQITEGRDASEMILNLLDETITGRSALTGRVMVYQGEVANLIPGADDRSDPTIQAFMEMED